MEIRNTENGVQIGGVGTHDYIYNEGQFVTMVGGDGNDTLDNNANNVTILGGEGKDQIETEKNVDNIYIDSGNDDDVIYNGGFVYEWVGNANYITMIAGNGDDTIGNSGSFAFIDAGEGNDDIRLSAGENRTNTNAGEYVGEYVTALAGNGNDTVFSQFVGHLSINGGGGNDFIVMHGVQGEDGYEGQVTIHGDDDNDTIRAFGSSVVAAGDNGDDYILSRFNSEGTGGEQNTLIGGVGNDTLEHKGNYALIDGGFGDDTVIIGENSKAAFIHAVGDGYDLVIGFNSDDTIITNTDSYQTIRSGNDLNIQIGDGNICLKDFVEENINIISVAPTTPTTPAENSANVDNPAETSSAPICYIYNVYYNENNNIISINQTENNFINNITNNNINNTNIVVINKTDNHYTYNGGNSVINNYAEGEVVQLNGDYRGIDLQGNSFIVKLSGGDLEIQNCKNKFVGYSGGDNNVVAYSYVASGGGAIDGRGKSQPEIIIGGDNANNQIFAGSGGSSLWGGNGGSDTLTGGNGYDEFFFAIGSGNDVVQNAGSNDVINLLGVSLSQISGFSYDNSSVTLNFNDGGNLRVEGNNGVGYRLENQIYVCNQSTGEWYTR